MDHIQQLIISKTIIFLTLFLPLYTCRGNAPSFKISSQLDNKLPSRVRDVIPFMLESPDGVSSLLTKLKDIDKSSKLGNMRVLRCTLVQLYFIRDIVR